MCGGDLPVRGPASQHRPVRESFDGRAGASESLAPCVISFTCAVQATAECQIHTASPRERGGLEAPATRERSVQFASMTPAGSDSGRDLHERNAMTDLHKRRKRIRTLLAAGLMFAASTLHAAPVTFGISGASLTPGSGYGIDNGANGENGGQLLAVQFTNTFLVQAFSLDSVGDSFTFDLATISFNEPNTGNGGNLGIRNDELDNLGVGASFTFTGPFSTVASLLATGTATPGSINDTGVDYVIAWDPVEADFGAAGRFRLSVNSLSFSGTGSGTAHATIELLAAGADVRSTVPEPTSLALVGAALAGAAVARRRRSAYASSASSLFRCCHSRRDGSV